jgi:3-deoxy-D-manno-octulosonate 8-phosphate phosphatase (KDO 8-P phosphatase)
MADAMGYGRLGALEASELVRRSRNLRLVITDVDGVLTDAGVYYSARGEELKRFNLRDGMGVELLRRDGVETSFLSRENSDIVRRRAEKLQIAHAYLGVRDKAARLAGILSDHGCSLDQVAYIGDDVNDLDVMLQISKVGLIAAPADAAARVLEIAHFVTASRGGYGAFRDFAELLLDTRHYTGRVSAWPPAP